MRKIFATWKPAQTSIGLSIILLPLWMLAIPGTPGLSSQIIGWNIGFFSLILYPVATFLIMHEYKSHKKRLREDKEVETVRVRYIGYSYFALSVFIAAMVADWIPITGLVEVT